MSESHSGAEVSLGVSAYVACLLARLGDRAEWGAAVTEFVLEDWFAQRVYPVPPPPPPPVEELLEDLIRNLRRAMSPR